jgi:DNA-binding transcriptional ArsR family regulator
MNRTTYQEALTRMSRYTVGVKEATALFAIGDGATVNEIADRSKSDRATTHIRLGMLRQKGLVYSDRVDTPIVYRLTREGIEIVTRTIGTNETRN